MTTGNIALKSYKNNDYKVIVCNDGSKIRYGESFNPIFPESIDLKITNYCDLGCPFCHEHSTLRGKHGNPDKIISRLQGLPEGIELAIGGGNPLDFPNIVEFFSRLNELGFIVNMTVNSEHLIQEKYIKIIDNIFHNRLINGLGISGSTKNKYISYDNTVNHFIIGEQSLEEFQNISKIYNKILLLGYKTYGRGHKYFQSKQGERIRKNILVFNEYFKHPNRQYPFNIVSFDNLAINQLNLKENMKDFEDFFMGEDGEFTMYYDGVTDTYAKSSTSIRMKFSNIDKNIRSVFKKY